MEEEYVMSLTELRRRLGAFGVWLPPQLLLATPIAVQRKEFARIEDLGYGSLWSGDVPPGYPGGREAFVQHGLMLAATERIVVGTGIANIQARDPAAMHTGAATFAEAYPGRFILGLGGAGGDRPITRLTEYLDAMDTAAETLLPEVTYPRVLAALGPRANRLAANRAQGAHPFLQPVAHTEVARGLLGSEPLLIPQQMLVLDTDPDSARAALRGLFPPRGVGNNPYDWNFRRLGYTDADLADGRSDRLVDAVLAWGDEAAVAERLHAQRAAGADHVLLTPHGTDLPSVVDQLERLAPLLTA